MKKVQQRSGCPVSFSLDYLGDKWTLLILRDIVLYSKSSYGEFLASDEKIATNILADRLSSLEKYGFIAKKASTEKKNKYLFNLTEKGIGLIPVIMEMSIWGSKYNPPGDEQLLKALRKDRNGIIKKYQQKLRALAKASS